MHHRLTPAAARIALVAVVIGAALGMVASLAWAYVTSDLVDWNLTESVSTYGGGTQFHISSSTDGWVSYRWLDSPSKTTVVSSNACGDYALLGNAAVIGAGDTGYHNTFQGGTYQCFVMRGRTASGSGAMYYYDGRVQR